MPAPALREERILEVLSAAYRCAPTFADWREQLMTSVRDLHEGAQTCTWFEYDWSFADGGLSLDSIHSSVVRGPDAATDTWLGARQKVPARLRAALFGRTGAGTASQISGLGDDVWRAESWRELWCEPIVDSFGLAAVDTRGHGVCISVGLPAVRSFGPRERQVFARLAVHVSAGLRLQRATSAGPPAASLEDGGRPRHAALSGTRPADRALAVWRGLLDGRWSLVDHLESDGKRLLVALRNAPRLERRADLTPRERQVTALVALGHRDKEIVYALGLSPAAVSSALHRAKAKLGVTTRSVLAAAWRGETSRVPDVR